MKNTSSEDAIAEKMRQLTKDKEQELLELAAIESNKVLRFKAVIATLLTNLPVFRENLLKLGLKLKDIVIHDSNINLGELGFIAWAIPDPDAIVKFEFGKHCSDDSIEELSKLLETPSFNDLFLNSNNLSQTNRSKIVMIYFNIKVPEKVNITG